MLTESEFEQLKERADAINASIKRLEGVTNELTVAQAREISKLNRINFGLLVVTAVLVVLSLFILYQRYRSDLNSQRISEIQAVGSAQSQKTAAEQQLRKTLVFCPILEQALSTYDQTGHAAKADPAQYERTFAGLERGATHLECDKRTRGIK